MKSQSLEDSVSNLLRYGVLLCGALIVGGLLSAFVSHDSTVFATAAALLRGASLPHSALRPFDLLASPGGLTSPEGWVTAGIAMLVALPAVRVAWLVFAFSKNGERAMALLATAVLGMLFLGFALGATH